MAEMLAIKVSDHVITRGLGEIVCVGKMRIFIRSNVRILHI